MRKQVDGVFRFHTKLFNSWKVLPVIGIPKNGSLILSAKVYVTDLERFWPNNDRIRLLRTENCSMCVHIFSAISFIIYINMYF